MAGCKQHDCTALLSTPPSLDPNPDVSGIGVLVTFIVTAYLVFILLVAHYVLIFDPAEAGLDDETLHINPIDVKILYYVGKVIPRAQKTWEKAIEKIVLMMSDQQMITGIALLFSAFMQLRCGISSYYWQIMIYLVWFSSFTHLATLTVLRRYFYANPSMRLWRISFMALIIALLIAALVPTGNKNWLSDSATDGDGNPIPDVDFIGVPAACFFKYLLNSDSSDAASAMIFSVLLLFFSYITRAIKLFDASSKFVRFYVRTEPGIPIKQYLQSLHTGVQRVDSNKWFIYLPYYVIFILVLVIRSWLDLFESMFWEISWLFIALMWGTLRLFGTRNTTTSQDKTTMEENSWGFGQCLAIAMFSIILFAGLETYFDTKKNAQQNSAGVASPKLTAADVDSPVDESQSCHPSDRERSEGSERLADDHLIAENMVELDISTQAPTVVRNEEFSQNLARSATTLSVEERSIANNIRRQPQDQSSLNGVELNDLGQSESAAEAVVLESAELPLHERNFYSDRWYFGVGLFNFMQMMIVSAGILSSAYSTGRKDSTDTGLFGQNIPAILQRVINWICFYAPFSSFVYTMLMFGFHSSRQAVIDALRKLFGKEIMFFLQIYLEASIFMAVGVFSALTLFLEDLNTWENWLPIQGKSLSFLPICILLAVGIPWCLAVSRKLERTSRN